VVCGSNVDIVIEGWRLGTAATWDDDDFDVEGLLEVGSVAETEATVESGGLDTRRLWTVVVR